MGHPFFRRRMPAALRRVRAARHPIRLLHLAGVAAVLSVLVTAPAPPSNAAAPPAGPATGPAPTAEAGPRRTADDATAYVWPLAPVPQVTRGFAPPQTRYGRGHRGVDLAGTPGIPVRSAGPGVVAFAGPVAGRGVVSVDHPSGLRTTYEPLTPAVSAGDPVSAGSVIGTLASGHAGCPRAACLHWGLRDGEDYLDPRSLLGSVTVRLLPV